MSFLCVYNTNKNGVFDGSQMKIEFLNSIKIIKCQIKKIVYDMLNIKKFYCL